MEFIRVIEVLIVVFSLAALAVWLRDIYNALLALRNSVMDAYSRIDQQLRRRYELIPNFVESLKGGLQHERGTLDDVIRARGAAVSAAQDAAAHPGDAAAMQHLAQAEGVLGSALGRLLTVYERSPDLKANESVSALQQELASTDNDIASARQAYNDGVTEYNLRRESFPNALLAGPFGFPPAEFLR